MADVHSRFLILPSTFDSDAKLRVSTSAVGIFGVALLTMGFSLSGLVCFACKDCVFRADRVFVPCLYSSLLGVLTVFYSFIVSSRHVWNVAALLVTVGSAVASIVYAALLVFTYRNVALARQRTGGVELMRQASSVSPGSTYHDPSYFANHQANMYPAARPRVQEQRIAPEELGEDDLLRQQMLMLLINKPNTPSGTTSAADSFNHIDFTPLDEPDPTPLLASGADAYQGYSAPGGPGTVSYSISHSLTQSASSSSWQGRTLQPWDGIWRGDGIPPTRPDATMRREERRREIEQGR